MFKNVRFIAIGLCSLLTACQSGTTTTSSESQGQPGVHKIVVDNVMQASNYTYLHGKENDKEQWVAVPTMQAKAGETYYYKGGLEMTKFESKELNKVFESITLLERVSKDPNNLAADAAPAPAPEASNPATATASAGQDMPAGQDDGSQYRRTSTPPEKKAVKVTAAKGGISIAELYAKKDSYAGKTVKIRGQVTKYTPAVMNKNWIHIQDGTDFQGKFDLAVTSAAETQVGETITVEGKISLNKDLGYGYFFDVIIEDAVISK